METKDREDSNSGTRFFCIGLWQQVFFFDLPLVVFCDLPPVGLSCFVADGALPTVPLVFVKVVNGLPFPPVMPPVEFCNLAAGCHRYIFAFCLRYAAVKKKNCLQQQSAIANIH